MKETVPRASMGGVSCWRTGGLFVPAEGDGLAARSMAISWMGEARNGMALMGEGSLGACAADGSGCMCLSRGKDASEGVAGWMWGS